jgi:hypothetical protein
MPFQGLNEHRLTFPGRCPGLLNHAPLGLQAELIKQLLRFQMRSDIPFNLSPISNFKSLQRLSWIGENDDAKNRIGAPLEVPTSEALCHNYEASDSKEPTGRTVL